MSNFWPGETTKNSWKVRYDVNARVSSTGPSSLGVNHGIDWWHVQGELYLTNKRLFFTSRDLNKFGGDWEPITNMFDGRRKRSEHSIELGRGLNVYSKGQNDSLNTVVVEDLHGNFFVYLPVKRHLGVAEDFAPSTPTYRRYSAETDKLTRSVVKAIESGRSG